MSGPGADCIFCRIASGEIPARPAYSGERVLGFHDVNPVAPLHVLVVPREHVADASHLEPAHGPLLAEMMQAARQVAADAGRAEGGYRLVLNVGPDAGTQVAHLHMHVLGGRELGWPPG